MKKPQFVWMPKDRKGKYWIAWARHTKRLLVNDLNRNYIGDWKEEGISVVKVSLTEKNT